MIKSVCTRACRWAAAIILVGYAGQARADNSFYLGGSVWRADWNVGLADKQSENAISGAPIGSAISNAALNLAFGNSGASNQFTTAFFNTPANAQLTNLGIFGVYNFAEVWALNFNVTYGATTFQSTRDSMFLRSNPQSSCGTGCTNLAGSLTSFSNNDQHVNVSRKDLDVIFSRRITGSQFSLFGGVKIQDWSYGTDLISGARPIAFTTQPLTGGLMTGSSTGITGFQYQYDSRAIGPAFGVQYSLPIDKEQGLSAQVGLVYLFGSLKMTEVNTGISGDTIITNGTASSTIPGSLYAFRDEVADKLEMPGYTAALYYRRSVGESSNIRVGLFYQALMVKSTDPKDTGLTLITSSGATPIVFPATSRRIQPEFSVGGARDVFKGIAFSVTTKLW